MEHAILLGGYTRRINQGLHQASFDDKTGKIDNSRLIAKIENPTYLTTNVSGNIIFSLAQQDDQAGLVALKLVNNQWVKIAQIMAKQINGCHIRYHDACQSIYISNYHEGAIDVYRFADDQLSHLQRVRHGQTSVLAAQDQSRIHYSDVSKDGQWLYACNLGGDVLHQYRILEDGQLELVADHAMPEGMGPRHFVWHPFLDIMYVIGEFDNRVALCHIQEDGSIHYQESFDNIPDNLRDGASGAAIRITKDGRFLYTSTRYSNYITVYAVDDQGQLTRIQYIDTVGQVPRDFILDPSESYVLVPHQDSDYITIFKRDLEKGTLTFLSNEVEVPETVCITAIS